MHSLIYALVGLAATTLAFPATQEMAVTQKVAMMAELKVETDEFIHKYNQTIEFEQLQRWILDSKTPAYGCKRMSLIFARGTLCVSMLRV
jgi:hypothetical protein